MAPIRRLRDQLRAWYLRRVAPAPIVLLPLASPAAPAGRGESVALAALR